MKNPETSVVGPTPLSNQHLLLDKIVLDSKPMPMVLPVEDPPPPILIERLAGGALIQDNSPHRETKL